MQTLGSIVMVLLILFVGLAIDVGMLELRQSQLQTAADSAALGAEIEAERGTNNWVAMGKAEAAQNGFTDGSNNVSISLVEQPTTGPYANRYDALQATVTQSVRTIFLSSVTGGSYTLSASASALITPCIYILGDGSLSSPTLYMLTGDMDANSCPVSVSDNMTVSSYANVNVEAINIGGSAGSSSFIGETYPSPRYNAGTLSDPLSAVTSPSYSSCTRTGYSVTSGTATLNPGTYCKGLNLSNANVTLNPGLYIITGGGLWNSVTVTGTGVTLFFTSGGGGSYGTFKILNSTVTMSAPTSTANGGVTGVLVFADRNWSHTGAQDFQLLNSTFSGDGIWYMPKAGLEFWSCGTLTAPHYFSVIADNLYSAGTNFQPVNNFAVLPTGNPFRQLGSLVQ